MPSEGLSSKLPDSRVLGPLSRTNPQNVHRVRPGKVFVEYLAAFLNENLPREFVGRHLIVKLSLTSFKAQLSQISRTARTRTTQTGAHAPARIGISGAGRRGPGIGDAFGARKI
eukprot:232036_1